MADDPHFQTHLDHVAGVTLQTLSIEKGMLPDGTTHEITLQENNRAGKITNWKVSFLKRKGSWMVTGYSKER